MKTHLHCNIQACEQIVKFLGRKLVTLLLLHFEEQVFRLLGQIVRHQRGKCGPTEQQQFGQRRDNVHRALIVRPELQNVLLQLADQLRLECPSEKGLRGVLNAGMGGTAGEHNEAKERLLLLKIWPNVVHAQADAFFLKRKGYR